MNPLFVTQVRNFVLYNCKTHHSVEYIQGGKDIYVVLLTNNREDLQKDENLIKSHIMRELVHVKKEEWNLEIHHKTGEKIIPVWSSRKHIAEAIRLVVIPKLKPLETNENGETLYPTTVEVLDKEPIEKNYRVKDVLPQDEDNKHWIITLRATKEQIETLRADKQNVIAVDAPIKESTPTQCSAQELADMMNRKLREVMEA